MPDLSLRKQLRELIKSWVSTVEAAELTPLAQPISDIGRLDVDSLHAKIVAAQGGDTRDLFALYRDVISADNHLQMDIGIRKLALLGDPFSVDPADKDDADDVAAAAAIKAALDACPGFLGACSHLLDSVLFPVAVVQKVYRAAGSRYELAALVPVDAQLLDFTTGTLRIRDTDNRGYPLGTTQLPDLRRYIVHRGHLLSAPDSWGGPMRSILFWWLLGSMDRGWWSNFLDRYGTPFILGKYPTGDSQSRNVLMRAFQYAQKLSGLVVSDQTEVEIKSAAVSDSGEAYERFLDLCQREKSKLVLGRTLGVGGKAGGFGDGGQAINERELRQDIRQFDARLLAATWGEQFVREYQLINGIPGRCRLAWGGESHEEAAATATLLKDLSQAGLEPADDALPALSDRLGFTIRRSTRPALTTGPGFDADTRNVTALSLTAPISHAHQAESAIDAIAREAAAPLARAFRGNLAELQRIILESRSSDECIDRSREFLRSYRPGTTADLIALALEAYTANGAIPV